MIGISIFDEITVRGSHEKRATWFENTAHLLYKDVITLNVFEYLNSADALKERCLEE
jgi:hypothetical protein